MDRFVVVTLFRVFHSNQKKKPHSSSQYALFRKNPFQTNGLWDPKLPNFHKETYARGNGCPLAYISL